MGQKQLQHKKIDNFLKMLDIKEKKYIIKKCKEQINEASAFIVDFTINGKNIKEFESEVKKWD